MSKLEQQQQQKQQQQQREEEEKKARAAAAAAAAAAASAVLAPSFSSFAGWFFQAGKWVKWQVDRACAPPRRSKSPAYYLDEC
jgi:biotin carboxyl carrier protein